tara:strand:+ start:228 stop:662 length:435 start_codon:yes stop_codon:yes gene_type:complete
MNDGVLSYSDSQDIDEKPIEDRMQNDDRSYNSRMMGMADSSQFDRDNISGSSLQKGNKEEQETLIRLSDRPSGGPRGTSNSVTQDYNSPKKVARTLSKAPLSTVSETEPENIVTESVYPDENSSISVGTHTGLSEGLHIRKKGL